MEVFLATYNTVQKLFFVVLFSLYLYFFVKEINTFIRQRIF